MKRTTDRVLEELQHLTRELPGAEQYVMVHHPAFRVGKKPFVVVGMLVASSTATVSINLGHEAQHELLEDARFHKTPYMHHNGWVTILYDALQPGELRALTHESWRRVATKKQLAEREAAAPQEQPAKAAKAAAKKKPASRSR